MSQPIRRGERPRRNWELEIPPIVVPTGSELDTRLRWAETLPTADLQVLVIRALDELRRRRREDLAFVSRALRAA